MWMSNSHLARNYPILISCEHDWIRLQLNVLSYSWQFLIVFSRSSCDPLLCGSLPPSRRVSHFLILILSLFLNNKTEERKLSDAERPLLVQLDWHKDDREGRFLLRRMDQRTNVSFAINLCNCFAIFSVHPLRLINLFVFSCCVSVASRFWSRKL